MSEPSGERLFFFCCSSTQGSFQSGLESSRSTRHHGLVERVQRDRRFVSPVRPYRNRQVENSLYSTAYLSPPPDASWRSERNWSGNFPGDKSQLFRLPTTALNRWTNSDSALHTSVMNPPMGDFSMAGPALTPQGAGRSGSDGSVLHPAVFPYPVPPIEENVLDEDKLLKAWDAKKLSLPSSRPKSCEVPGINIFTSPEQPSTPVQGVPQVPNTGGSLPDLSSLHFPSPLPTPLDQDEPGYPASSALSGGSSTGNLASTLTQMGINTAGGNGSYHQPAPVSTLSNPNLQSSLSNPNIQSSLSSHSFSNSLSSASLHSSLSNPSLQSSLSSSPSLPSSLSSQSLHSSLSNSSLQSGGYGGGGGVAGSGSSPYSAMLTGQGQVSLSTSPRRRAQLSPLILPMAGESRRIHPKQFSPTMSPTLSSISQGVPLDTSRLPADQRLPPYPLSQPGQQNPSLGQNQQMLRLQQPRTNQQQLHLQNLRNQHLQQFGPFCPPPAGGSTSPAASLTSLLPLLQFPAESPVDGLNHSGPGQNQFPSNSQGALELQQPGDPQRLNHQNQNRNYSGGDGRQNVPNIILTGDSPPGLSKEITSALSHVPGFEMDAFSLDEPLRIDPLALDLLEGELMLADPAVEDSFRSDRLK
uniref:CREB regulated transcription coactivator 2 n=1 Tax=Poecilia formosa TaxID=48698 RepID=A0A087Y9N7_POEFO